MREDRPDRHGPMVEDGLHKEDLVDDKFEGSQCQIVWKKPHKFELVVVLHAVLIDTGTCSA